MIERYVAIDVETANPSPTSVCSLGFVVVDNRTIISKNQFTINPGEVDFSGINTRIHGISREHTLYAPTLDQLWSRIKIFFTDIPIVAHNATFDINCLEKSLFASGIQHKFDQVHCTYKLTGKKLKDLCKELKLELNHHDSLSDASACALIFDHLQHTGEGMSLIQKKKIQSRNAGGQYHKKIRSEFLRPKEDVLETDNPFYQNKVVISGVFASFTRNELAEKLYNLGADIDSSVTKKTNYVVAGENMGPAKRRKAETLGIPIISEDKFLTMIDHK